MPNMPQFVFAYFGTLKGGGIVVPCSPLYKEKELEYQLNDSGASFVVAANDVVKDNDLFSSLEACRGRLKLNAVIAASVTEYLPGLKRSLAGFAGVKNVSRKGTMTFRSMVDSNKPLETSPRYRPYEGDCRAPVHGRHDGHLKGRHAVARQPLSQRRGGLRSPPSHLE